LRATDCGTSAKLPPFAASAFGYSILRLGGLAGDTPDKRIEQIDPQAMMSATAQRAKCSCAKR